MLCLFVLLQLLALAVSEGSGEGDSISPAPTSCTGFTESDGKAVPHMETRVEMDGGRLVLHVKCEEGYLLVPKNETTLLCNETTGKWIFPECLEIPKVKFVNHSISHDMGSENPPKISVALTTAVVRAFVVEIAVKEEDSTAVNRNDFELQTNNITFSEKETTGTVSVAVTDTLVSGKNKHFTLCLSIAHNESVNETRAKVEDGSDCLTVTINNTNKARLSFFQPFYIFTIAQQLLTFNVSYRTCPIQVTLCLNDTELGCKTVTILPKCGDVCVMDLVEQNNNFSFYQRKIGQYSANLTTTQKDCLVNIDSKETTIELTLTPEEIQENGTGISFARGMYKLYISHDGQWAKEQEIIDLAYTRDPDYAFQLRLNVTTDDSGDSDPLTWSTDVIVLPHHRDNINISELLRLLSSTGCGMTDTFNLELTALTTTSVAIVKSTAPVRLGVTYGTTVSFNSSSYFQSTDTALVVTISTTRCLYNLSHYITVQIRNASVNSGVANIVKTLSTSGGTMDWGYTWTVDDIPSEPLHHYTLSLTSVDNGKEIAWQQAKTEYISGAVLSFDKETYTFENNSVKVKVLSSRQLPGSTLEELVILNIVGVTKKTSATSDTSARETSDISKFKIKAGVKPTEEADHSVWVVTVNVTDDYKEKISSAKITLVVTDKMEGIIKLGSNEKTVIDAPMMTGTELPDAKESSTSWFSGTIAVLIAAVVVAVAIYVVFSRREQIVVWLKTTGGGEGGRKMLTKARTRLRSRGAYKKLPTSVQDAMTTKHND